MPGGGSPELLPATSPSEAVRRRWLFSGGDKFDVEGLERGLPVGGTMTGAGATPGGAPVAAGGDFDFAQFGFIPARSIVATGGGADFGIGGSRIPAALRIAGGGGLEGGGGGLGDSARGGGGGAFGSSGRRRG